MDARPWDNLGRPPILPFPTPTLPALPCPSAKTNTLVPRCPLAPQVVEEDPLKLFEVEGSSRVDAVYAISSGQLYLMVYITDPGTSRPIT